MIDPRAATCRPCRDRRLAARHGTATKYQLGCRCPACTDANRRAYHERIGQGAPRHGYSGYVNYRCRCDVCRAAAAAYWLERKSRRAGSNHEGE